MTLKLTCCHFSIKLRDISKLTCFVRFGHYEHVEWKSNVWLYIFICTNFNYENLIVTSTCPNFLKADPLLVVGATNRSQYSSVYHDQFSLNRFWKGRTANLFLSNPLVVVTASLFDICMMYNFSPTHYNLKNWISNNWKKRKWMKFWNNLCNEKRQTCSISESHAKSCW